MTQTDGKINRVLGLEESVLSHDHTTQGNLQMAITKKNKNKKIPHAATEILHAATKSQHSQINK